MSNVIFLKENENLGLYNFFLKNEYKPVSRTYVSFKGEEPLPPPNINIFVPTNVAV